MFIQTHALAELHWICTLSYRCVPIICCIMNFQNFTGKVLIEYINLLPDLAILQVNTQNFKYLQVLPPSRLRCVS